MDPMQQEAPQSAAEQRIRAEISAIVGELEAEARRRVGQRKPVEERWMDDLRQYHGLYDDATIKRLNANETSTAYIPITGPKTDAMAARLMDLLFPTDDRNWGIQPTPVPELTEQAKQAAQMAEQKRMEALAQAQAAQEAQGGPEQAQQAQQMAIQAMAAQQQADQAKAFADSLQAQLAEGRKRAENMADEIDDQLTQSRYPAVVRDVIEDACKLGTGVAEGPVTGQKMRKGWKKRPVIDQMGNPVGEEFALEMSEGDQPGMNRINVWDFFPDMDFPRVEDGNGVFIRYLHGAKDLRALAKLPGFDQDAIRRLLREKPRETEPWYIASLRQMGANTIHSTPESYHVWKYSGPLEAKAMMALAQAAGDTETISELTEVDPLDEMHAVVWFCQSEVLKFSVYPYDSNECMYSVFCLKKDEYSVFGYGIPYMMRDLQASVNSGWRNMLDNAAVAAGPQIVVDSEKIEPEGGDWKLKPRKVWMMKAPWESANPPFWTFDIPMRQAELANIIELSRRMIDEVTAMPMIAQGEQGSGVTKTAQGMSLLMNSANVTFRRIVKNFDDDFTTPTIRRFYDWNMQHSRKEAIKGDYEVDARGSSVLLVREMQAQNLFMIALHLGAHPVYGTMLQNRALLRRLFQAHMLSSDELVLTDEEIDAILMQAAAQSEQDKGAAQAAQMDAEHRKAELEFRREELRSKIAIANMEKDARLKEAQMRYELELQKSATNANIKLDELESRFRVEDAKIQAAERRHAVELATTQQIGPSGGGTY